MNKSARRYEIFCREYVIDLNGARAAIAAGYSEKAAKEQASELLTKPNVQAKINELLAKKASKLDISAEKVLMELRKLAFFDPRCLYREDGSPKPVNELDEESAAAIEGIDIEDIYQHFGRGQSQKVGVVKRYRLASKGQNLERLGRHLKLFTDKVEVSGLEGLGEALSRARKRAEGK